MFSRASVSHSVHGKGDFLSHVPSGGISGWYHVPSWRGEGMPSTLVCFKFVHYHSRMTAQFYLKVFYCVCSCVSTGLMDMNVNKCRFVCIAF